MTAPLSDGGRVLDVPLILALSVDPVSTSMSNKNTDGGPIWGHKMGLEFNQHVDHLFYMSGKPVSVQPAMLLLLTVKVIPIIQTVALHSKTAELNTKWQKIMYVTPL